MNAEKTVQCYIHGSRSTSKPYSVCFDTGSDLQMRSTAGKVGPKGITTRAADLVDIAATVYQIEKQLRGRQRTNPPRRIELSMQLREPNVWNSEAVELVEEALWFLGNAEWVVELKPGLQAGIPEHQLADESEVKQVVLFSGGMDSTCGIACIREDIPRTRLVSYYTGQKTLQRNIASGLGFSVPIQWGKNWKPKEGRGHTFRYRSFLFFCLAAAVAESWEVQTILQFENGVLASAIPPSPAWMMTKHAHPRLHSLLSELFASLFGGEWQIDNPFLFHTKRDCFNRAVESIGEAKAKEIMQKTETCWFHRSNRVIGGKKKPGVACGVCIPCIVRRTALQDNMYHWDLRDDSVKNDPKLGIAFRSYFGFLERVANTEYSPADFYGLLPASGRSLVTPGGMTSLQDLHALFLRFSNEFMETYQL